MNNRKQNNEQTGNKQKTLRPSVQRNKLAIEDARGDITECQPREEDLQKSHDELEIKVQERTVQLKKINEELQSEIMHRQEVEESLRKAYQFNSAILNTSDALIMVSTSEGKIVSFNTACEQASGYLFKEVMGRYPWDFVVQGENVETVKAVYKKLRTGEQRKNTGENYWLTRDGQKRLIRWNNTTLPDKDGMLEYIVSSGIDITEQYEAEAALKESEAYYRTVFENTGSAIAILEEDLTISMVNNKFQKLSGYAKKEIENKKKWTEFIDYQYQETTKGYYYWRNSEPELVPREYEINFINRFGKVRNALISVDIIPGTLKRAISIVDITRQKQTQQELEKNIQKMQKMLSQTVSSLATALEINDPYTAGHQRKMGRLATAIAKEMSFSNDQIEGISVAANLHDIGKINVPSEILSKPGKLSEIEWQFIKTHSQAGYEIIKEIEFPWPVADIVLQHHERIDGSGYPRGLAGDEILIGARILAVADVIEAMASHRPYRPSLGLNIALEEISQNKGILYDPEVVDACLKLFKEKGYQL